LDPYRIGVMTLTFRGSRHVDLSVGRFLFSSSDSFSVRRTV